MFQVIVRFQDGSVLKGLLARFRPTSGRLRLWPLASCPGTRPLDIDLADLKGVFFVHHLDGNPAHRKRNRFDPTDLTPGHPVRVLFQDGEVLLGRTQDFHPERGGFFLLPADTRSNNERCYVVTAATREATLLELSAGAVPDPP